MLKKIIDIFSIFLTYLLCFLSIPIIEVLCRLSKRFDKRFDVGLGPKGIISNIYHKKSLELYNYSAETFCDNGTFITREFDCVFHENSQLPVVIKDILLFIRCIFKYRCLYMTFEGGPLRNLPFLSALEPHYLRASNVRTVILPFGSDIQVMTRSPELCFRHALAMDYPQTRRYWSQVDKTVKRWFKNADFIIGGLEWVDYMPGWDELMLNHFSIDMEKWSPINVKKIRDVGDPLVIFHAPNHKEIKGSNFLIRAVDELKSEGLDIQLDLVQGVANKELKARMENADIVFEQMVLGWYAMFALEGLCLGKPVICGIRTDLEDLYLFAGKLAENELPFIRADFKNLKEVLKGIYYMPQSELNEIAQKGPAFVSKHHSPKVIGKHFDHINKKLGV
ncbi:Glycosyltransferase [Candidatus Terasakiella magnetica]|uniref:Glycosyltransferase n=1 Tax=Candidatus Terasakiella magnetica TaxID=1867952 RepID=A0A1C3RG43_9PROT|nr:hypothetical protein [Candidatus Terasakiella magnetica]SCA56229.1 Glycosyltransferase [Candidatus Terasakiella magnetica]